MKYEVKAFDLDGSEYEFENTVIGKDSAVIFESEKAAEAFITGIRISLPNTFQYKIIPREDESK